MEKKLVTTEKKINKRESIYQKIKKGSKLKGKVKSIQPYGIFVDIGNRHNAVYLESRIYLWHA